MWLREKRTLVTGALVSPAEVAQAPWMQLSGPGGKREDKSLPPGGLQFFALQQEQGQPPRLAPVLLGEYSEEGEGRVTPEPHQALGTLLLANKGTHGGKPTLFFRGPDVECDSIGKSMCVTLGKASGYDKSTQKCTMTQIK